MNRSSLNDFIGLRGKTQHHPRKLAFEPLEERRLLTANDLLIGVLSSVDGQAVERYSAAAAGGLVGGGAAVDYVNNFGFTSGLAVAPDGTYYVSSLYGTVMHYTNSGIFLNDVGAGDFAEPGTLAFGPNGNLYVADLMGGVIDQFDVSSSTPVLVNTLQLPANFSPGGITFSNDATNDLIVGDAGGSGEILQYQGPSYTSYSVLLPAGTQAFVAVPVPLSLLELSNGNLLIADSTLGGDPQYHHQILEYDPTAQSMSQLIDLSTLVPQGDLAPQPTSLLLASDGNLLVGFSPDQGPTDGTVEEFNLTTGAPIATVVTSIGPPAGLAYVPPLAQISVPSSAWNGSGLTVTGDAADAGGTVHVYTTNTSNDVVTPQSANVLGGIQIARDNATNALTIDFSGGDPIPPDGVSFTGGQGTAVNSLVVSAPTATSALTLRSSSLDLTNVPTINLDLGSGAFDISDLSPGVSSVTLTSGVFTLSSGTVDANLNGSNGLMMTGPGAATLAGTNDIQGGIAVTGGTLVATSPAALPNGSMLMVGANVSTAFGGASAAAAQSSAAAPLAVAAPGTKSAAKFARSAGPGTSAAPVGTVKQSFGEESTTAAFDAVQKSYNKNTVAAAVQRSGAAEFAALWNLASLPPGPQDSPANNRLAAIDAAIVEYGAR